MPLDILGLAINEDNIAGYLCVVQQLYKFKLKNRHK